MGSGAVMCPDSFNFGAVYMFACLRVHVHNILFVSVVCVFLNSLFLNFALAAVLTVCTCMNQ